MRILLDTSVLVAAMIEGHPRHPAALPWLKRAKDETNTGLVAAHSLAELYSVLTTLPIRPPIAPVTAWQLIEQDVLQGLEVVALTGEDYRDLVQYLSGIEIAGGATYDAVILWAARRANADQVVTLNPKDFQRVMPQLAERIVSP